MYLDKALVEEELLFDLDQAGVFCLNWVEIMEVLLIFVASLAVVHPCLWEVRPHDAGVLADDCNQAAKPSVELEDVGGQVVS